MSLLRNPAMPPPLLRFWAGVLALTALSTVCTFAMTSMHHTPHPWGVQLLWGADFGWDLNIFRDRFLLFRTPGFWQLQSLPLTYPAAVGVVFGLLYKLTHPLRDYLLLCTAAVVAWMAWLVQALASRRGARGPAIVFVITVAATCWPLWVLFDTANIEGLVAILLGAGLLSFVHRRWWLATTFIGIAAAMKVFPIILLGLLLSQRRYREFAGGIAIALILTLASLSILGPSIPEAQRQINLGLRVVTTGDALAAISPGPDTNHSLYTVVRYAVLLAHHRHPHASYAGNENDAAMLRPAYLAYLFLGAIAALAAYVFRIRHLPMLNQMLALTVCAVALPPLSRDYTLVHLLVPFGLLCAYAAEKARHGETIPGLTACFACLAFIFTAGTYFNIKYLLASEVRGLILLTLFLILLKYPLPWAYFDTPFAVHDPTDAIV